MLYTTFKVKDTEYKLRLTTRAMIDVEKRLGENPLNIFMKMGKDANGAASELPQISTLITILWGALQPYNHGMNEAAVCDLYDEFVDDGHNLFDLVPIILEVFKVSGFLQNDTKEDAEKN